MAHELDPRVEKLLKAALDEDLGADGDITSDAIFTARTEARAVIAAKQAGVLSGVTLIEPLFGIIDKCIKVTLEGGDGDRLDTGSRIALLDGPIRGLLAGERTILNLLQHLSGIATATAELVERLSGCRTRVLDTRKTTPLLRSLEKAAVVHGGGHNHRLGLFDMVLIKDTHVRAAGGPGAAVRAVKKHMGEPRAARIEVEVQSIEEFEEALNERPDRIMLDNMSCDLMRRCVERARAVQPDVELEASGTIDADTIRGVAETGVDFVSVGRITHSAPALDIHMTIVE